MGSYCAHVGQPISRNNGGLYCGFCGAPLAERSEVDHLVDVIKQIVVSDYDLAMLHAESALKGLGEPVPHEWEVGDA